MAYGDLKPSVNLDVQVEWEGVEEMTKELKPFAFRVVVQATDLDRAIEILKACDFDVNNPEEVIWLD